MKKVSINIVNWNGMGYLEDCIRSIFQQSYSNIEINIVDNNSKDGSYELIKKKYPCINFIKNEENVGFSKAHNQAIEMSKGDYILPLNFDILLNPDFVKNMVKAAESSQKIGIVSGKLYKLIDGKKTNIIDSTGITMNCMFPADRGENSEDEGQFSKREYIFGASGAAPLLKRKMLEDIKIGNEYFDEDFVIYVEDVDLCWRAQNHGWKALFEPKAIAYHYRGITRKDSRGIQIDYSLRGHRNRYWAIIKNCPVHTIIRKFHLILLKESYFYSNNVLIGNFYILNTPFNVFRGLSNILKKRRSIQRNGKVKEGHIEKLLFRAK